MIQNSIGKFIEDMKIPETREDALKIFELIHKGFPQELAHESVLGREDTELTKELKTLLVKVIEQNTEIKFMSIWKKTQNSVLISFGLKNK